jgi:ABC-type transport system substrate-binding protein
MPFPRGDAASMSGMARRGLAALLAAAIALSPLANRPALAADPGKVLRIEFYVAETGFDPVKVQDYYSQTVCEAIFEPLMTYDYLARPAKLAPRAAEAMPVISDQARTYVFKIRKGIYFAPDPVFKGKPRELTAEDYAYTIKRFRDPANKSPYESFLGGVVGLDEVKKDAEKTGKFDYDRKVEGLQVLDRYTLRVKLKETDYNFAHILALPNTGAVAREVIEAYADDTNAHPVGTGPYMLTEWKRSNKIVLEANPSFRGFIWHFEPSSDPEDKARIAAMEGKKMPQIGRVEISIIEEQQAAWLAFQNNELDILYLREQFAPVALPNNKLNADLARRGVTLNRTTDPDIN